MTTSAALEEIIFPDRGHGEEVHGLNRTLDQ
jgi:hypothetical protein